MNASSFWGSISVAAIVIASRRYVRFQNEISLLDFE
jgi:hypothetical protein